MKKLVSIIGIAFLALRVVAQPPPPQPDLLGLYGQLTGRTILHGAVPAISLAGIQLPADTDEAIKLIETELAKHQIDCVRDGDKFIRLLPMGWRDTVMGRELARLKLSTNHAITTNSAGTNTMRGRVPRDHVFRSGDIDFPNTSVLQVLDLYSHLAERTVMPPADLPPITISLKSQNPLTIDEVIYALKTVFILNGFAIVDDDEKTSRLVYLSQINK